VGEVGIQVAQVAKRAYALLLPRLAALEQRIEQGDESAWAEYLETVQTLATLLPHLQPGVEGRMLTTREMADRLNVSTKTLRKWGKAGNVPEGVKVVRNGVAGRAAIRWKG
jgi:hypothetical protein